MPRLFLKIQIHGCYGETGTSDAQGGKGPVLFSLYTRPKTMKNRRVRCLSALRETSGRDMSHPIQKMAKMQMPLVPKLASLTSVSISCPVSGINPSSYCQRLGAQPPSDQVGLSGLCTPSMELNRGSKSPFGGSILNPRRQNMQPEKFRLGVVGWN